MTEETMFTKQEAEALLKKWHEAIADTEEGSIDRNLRHAYGLGRPEEAECCLTGTRIEVARVLQARYEAAGWKVEVTTDTIGSPVLTFK